MIRTGKSNPIYKDVLGEHPEMYDKKHFVDTALTAYRFFENGYVEITSVISQSVHMWKSLMSSSAE